MASQLPRLIATVGLHSSASTWVFNIVRELMVASLGAENVVAVFSDDVVADLLTKDVLVGRHVVLKSHHGGAGLDTLLWLTRAPMFLSIRDPRDAALSLVQRFGGSLPAAVRGIGRDCLRLERCAEAGHPVFRYEDKFFEDAAMPGVIAKQLGVALEPSVLRSIFDRYSTESVKTFAANLAALSADRAIINAEAVEMDNVTQIHRTHIGDGRIGKWRDLLSPQDRAALTKYFAPFLARFGYES